MQNTHETQNEVIESLQNFEQYSEGINLSEINGVAKQMQPFLKEHGGDDIRLTTAVAFALGTRHGVKQERARRKESEFTSEMGNRQARIELDNKLFQLEQKISKAQLLMADVLDNYMRALDPQKEEDKWRIMYSFNRYGEFSEIAFDYVCEVQTLIGELTDIHTEDELNSKTE